MTLLQIKVKQPSHSERNDAIWLNDPGNKVNDLINTHQTRANADFTICVGGATLQVWRDARRCLLLGKIAHPRVSHHSKIACNRPQTWLGCSGSQSFKGWCVNGDLLCLSEMPKRCDSAVYIWHPGNWEAEQMESPCDFSSAKAESSEKP